MSGSGARQTIGERMKEIRLRKNMTQEEIAWRAGISKLSVVNAEAGKNISLATLIAILRQLGLIENLEQLIPEPPISPILLKKLKEKKDIEQVINKLCDVQYLFFATQLDKRQIKFPRNLKRIMG